MRQFGVKVMEYEKDEKSEVRSTLIEEGEREEKGRCC